jgi:hypothetical protein
MLKTSSNPIKAFDMSSNLATSNLTCKSTYTFSLEHILFIFAVILAIIDTSLKEHNFIGGWHIVFYIVLLLPLWFFHIKGLVQNRHTFLFLPMILVWIWDIFYYNNTLTQFFLPAIVVVSIVMLYLSATQETTALYQSIFAVLRAPFSPIAILGAFVQKLFLFQRNSGIVRRILLAIGITLPFLLLFIYLLRSADSEFYIYTRELMRLNHYFSWSIFVLTPLKSVLLLIFLLYAAANHSQRTALSEGAPFDALIVSIFLTLLGILFASFISFQIPFLLQDNAAFYANKNVDQVALFAREGFFQLMEVMGIVVSIYLVIMQRFKNESYLRVLLTFLMVETMIMGLVSLKKMALYQELMGATVLRYYVEWFDYFLLFALALGIVFMFWRIAFHRLIDTIVVLALLVFTLIASLNVDNMVASYNIEKFAQTPKKLDIAALQHLSVDALPSMKAAGIKRKEHSYTYYEKYAHCYSFATYHYGYCSRLGSYTLEF